MKNSDRRKLLLLFLFIFLAKAAISLFMSGTFLYSDEACVLLKARELATNFKLGPCIDATHAPAGNPLPFYSIFIAPVYLFFTGLKAYHAILILNSFLVASLCFPLYKIYRRFIPKGSKIFLYIFITLFLPLIIVFEKMLMTETLFTVLNIWLFSFYLESFYTHTLRNKIVAIFLAILATLTRPFGFIVILAIAINELVQSKRKKLILLTLVPFSILVIVLVFQLMPSLTGVLINRAETLLKPANLVIALTAIKNQFNSLIVITYLVPFILFVALMAQTKIQAIKKIRFFIVSLITLNFIVATYHLYGYLLPGNGLDLLTRYINISGIYILLFSFVYLHRYKNFKINALNTITIVLTLAALFFMEYDQAKHSLNLVLSNFYDTSHFSAGNRAASNTFLAYYFPPITFFLFLLLISNKLRLLELATMLIIVVHSFFLSTWIIDFSAQQNTDRIFNFFKDTEYNILYLHSYNAKGPVYPFWRLMALTDNHITSLYHNDLKPAHSPPDFSSEAGKKYLEENHFDYVFARYPLPYPHLPISTGQEMIYPVDEILKHQDD